MDILFEQSSDLPWADSHKSLKGENWLVLIRNELKDFLLLYPGQPLDRLVLVVNFGKVGTFGMESAWNFKQALSSARML